MAEKMYKVLDDQKYTGKHRVYCGKGAMGRTKGDTFPESELFGNEDNLKMSLEGADDKMDVFPEGSPCEVKEFIAIRGKEPKIELVKPPVKKAKKKKEDEKK